MGSPHLRLLAGGLGLAKGKIIPPFSSWPHCRSKPASTPGTLRIGAHGVLTATSSVKPFSTGRKMVADRQLVRVLFIHIKNRTGADYGNSLYFAQVHRL